MSSLPLIPESAPFSAGQRAWLNGFLAGVLNRSSTAPTDGLAGAAVGANALPAEKLLVLFGSQSGNAETLAKKLAKEATTKGFLARAVGLEAMKASTLTQEKNVLIISSTWGEGEMPDNAQSFWDELNQNGQSPKLEGLRYSVLALGDKNYGETFCLAGKKLDQRFQELGAVALTERVDCDVDFDAPAALWKNRVFSALGTTSTPATEITEEAPTGHTKANPFQAPLLVNRPLNGPGSAKATHHIALSLTGSTLDYEVGDALGVWVHNCPDVVNDILAKFGYDPATMVELPSSGTADLRSALLKHYAVRDWLTKTPEQPLPVSDFIASLRSLQPRLYSIASSPKAHPGEVHLTIGVVHYEADGFQHKGVASTFLTERLAIGEKANVFIQGANHFRLPTDTSLPVIMVGPGTGIAPFRAFLEERQATGATGKNWLFFGDQHRASDFLYQEQIMTWVHSGHLQRLDTAFSRDQAEKVYVQHRMVETARELWQWLEEGGYFYVCGDANRMAKDVDAALHQVIRNAGGKSPEQAAEYVAQMKKEKRYARDVY